MTDGKAAATRQTAWATARTGTSRTAEPRAGEELRCEVFGDPIHGEAVRYCLARLGALGGVSVADMGCGTGSVSVLLALEGARVVGIDIAPERLGRAAELAATCGVGESCSFLCRSAEDSGLEADSFDIVFSKSTLQYMDRFRALAEFTRVLRPGGTLVLVENLPHNPFVKAFRCVRGAAARTERERAYVSSIRGYVTRGEIEALRPGFDALDTRPYHLARALTIGLRRRPGAGRPTRALDASAATVDSAVLRALPGCGRLAWIVAVVCSGKRPARPNPTASPQAPRTAHDEP